MKRGWPVLLLFSACAPAAPEPQPPAPRPDPPPEPVVVGDAGATPADAGPTPNAAPMPTRPLEPKTTPWTTKTLPTPKRVGAGGVLLPGFANPDRVVVGTLDRKGALLDARTGKVLAKLPAQPEWSSPRAGAVVLRDDAAKTPRVLRLSDGAVVTPKIDAGNQALAKVWLATSLQRRTVVALAETKDGAKLAGILDPRFESVRLVPSLLEAKTKGFAAGVNGFDGYHLVHGTSLGHGVPHSFPAHGATCLGARLSEDGAVTCLEHTPASGVGLQSIEWLDGGWFSTSTGIGNVAWGDRITTFESALGQRGCNPRATHASPPRVLVTCDGPRRQPGRGAVWSPGGFLAFDDVVEPNDIGGLVGADSGRVLPVFDDHLKADGKPERAKRWIDVRERRMWTSPPLRPVALAAFAGVGPRFVVEDKPGEIAIVDVEAGTRETVGETKCPGELVELRDPGTVENTRFLIVACTAGQPKSVAATGLLWAEILDRETRTRLRTLLLPEVIFADGYALLSARRLMMAEARTVPSELFGVDLVVRDEPSRGAR